ncbi:hypothetical protein BKA62DRAFT_702246 [Auriculariales sp. MPI-PUGE-AT-0066]|nr:hypothetical protein BKA62DRAFT_702246 [Auriculariales sp. MPI-PUGE-AT-0066]
MTRSSFPLDLSLLITEHAAQDAILDNLFGWVAALRHISHEFSALITPILYYVVCVNSRNIDSLLAQMWRKESPFTLFTRHLIVEWSLCYVGYWDNPVASLILESPNLLTVTGSGIDMINSLCRPFLCSVRALHFTALLSPLSALRPPLDYGLVLHLPQPSRLTHLHLQLWIMQPSDDSVIYLGLERLAPAVCRITHLIIDLNVDSYRYHDRDALISCVRAWARHRMIKRILLRPSRDMLISALAARQRKSRLFESIVHDLQELATATQDRRIWVLEYPDYHIFPNRSQLVDVLKGPGLWLEGRPLYSIAMQGSSEGMGHQHNTGERKNSPLPHELHLLIAEYAAHDAVFDSLYGFIAGLCIVSRRLYTLITPILYHTVLVSSWSIDLLISYAQEEDSSFTRYARHLVIDESLKTGLESNPVASLIFEAPYLETITGSGGDMTSTFFRPFLSSVRALHLMSPILTNEGLDPILTADYMTVFKLSQPCRLTHLHLQLLLPKLYRELDLDLDSLTSTPCPLTHLLIDVDMASYRRKERAAFLLFVRGWTRHRTIRRLLFRPSWNMASNSLRGRGYDGQGVSLLFKSVVGDLQDFAEFNQERRIWVHERPEYSVYGPRSLMIDVVKAADLWLEGRPLYSGNNGATGGRSRND